MIPVVQWSSNKQSTVEAVWPVTLQFLGSIQALIPVEHLNDVFVETLKTLVH